MNQLTQLFRYVIPGGFLIIYVIIFSPLYGFEYKVLINNLKDYQALLIFLTPVLGYFVSSVHHMLYNLFQFYRVELNIKKYDEKSYCYKWSAYNIRWRKSSKNMWEELDKRNNSLTDLMHGNGAILISFILSQALLFFFKVFNPNHVLYIVFLLILLLCVHLYSFIITKKHLNYFVTLSMKELEKDKKK